MPSRKLKTGHQARRTDPAQDALRKRLIGMSAKARAMFDRCAARYEPPPILKLSEWTERPGHIVLPEGQSARAGNRWRNWPYMREVIDSIGDAELERVSVIKGTRIGYSKSICAAIGATAATDPCGIIVLLPTEKDCSKFAVDDLEPMFDSSPVLNGLLRKGRNDGRNTLTRKALMGGGSIKILAAMSPRNLRSHDAKKLFCDEVDGMDITKEGDPIALAIKRTSAHADRKIVLGSTPTFEDASIIDKAYRESDMRIYETPCPHCGTFFEILWKHIRWPEGRPQDAVCICPHCEQAHNDGRAPAPKPITEAEHKRAMIEAGVWRATAPHVENHRGYKISALISLIAHATWPILAAEYLQAKRAGPSELQVFANTVEARVWSNSINRVDATGLAAKAENFGLDAIPPWVVAITAGVDTQMDRLEVVLMGWPMFGAPAVLAHLVLDGTPMDSGVWKNLDTLLRRKWQHPAGWWIGVDCTAVDSGGTASVSGKDAGAESYTQQVYNYCDPRASRNIFAIKGDGGPRPIWKKAAKVKGGSRLAIIGVDQVKNEVMERLAQPVRDEKGELNPLSLRMSIDLTDDYYEQVTGEVKRVKYKNQRTIHVFEPKRRGQRVEALDCTVYAWAARHSPAFKRVPFAQRAAQLPEPGQAPAPVPPVIEDRQAPAVTIAAPAERMPVHPPKAPAPDAGGWAALFNGG